MKTIAKKALFKARTLLNHPPSLECISFIDSNRIQHNSFNGKTYLMSREKWIEAILKEFDIIEEELKHLDKLDNL